MNATAASILSFARRIAAAHENGPNWPPFLAAEPTTSYTAWQKESMK